MNCIRLIFANADNNGITIKSTIAKTYKLASKEDELLDFDDNDIVVIRNERSDPTIIRLAQFNPRRGQSHFVNVTSSRYGNAKRIHAQGDGGTEMLDVILEGGEAAILKAQLWRHPHGMGRTGPPE